MKLKVSSHSRRAERTEPFLLQEGETEGVVLSDEMATPQNHDSTSVNSSAHKRSTWRSFSLKRSSKKATPSAKHNNHDEENTQNRSSAKQRSNKNSNKKSTNKRKPTITSNNSPFEQATMNLLSSQRKLAFDQVAEQSMGIRVEPSFSSLVNERAPKLTPILPPAQEFVPNWQAASFLEGSTATKTCYDDSHQVVLVPDTTSLHSRSSSVRNRSSATASQSGGFEMTYQQTHQHQEEKSQASSTVVGQQQQQQRVPSPSSQFRLSQKAAEEKDDWGSQDFDPNDNRDDNDEDDDSLFDDDNDTYTTGMTAGPQSSTNSAFQFDLSAGHLKPNTATATTTKSNNESSASFTSSAKSSQHGFRIIATKSSLSSMFSPATSKATATTMASTATTSPSNRSSAGSSAVSRGSTPPAKKRAKAILKRPFGRNSLPRSAFQWLVDVSPAEWDNQERSWKYRVKVHRQKEAAPSPTSNGLPPITEAFTWRSLGSFVWLEKALHSEFQGGLVLPLLSIALGTPDLTQVTHEVDSKLLQEWLSDVLNGIRGHGELVLGQEPVDLMRSESIETFLYRNTVPLYSSNRLLSGLEDDIVGRQKQRQRVDGAMKEDFPSDGSNCHGCEPIANGRSAREPIGSFVRTLWTRPLDLMNGELCVGAGCQHLTEGSPSRPSLARSQIDKLNRFACPPGGLDDDDDDSSVDASTITSLQSSLAQQHQLKISTSRKPIWWRHARHTDLIFAERELLLNYRRAALISLDKCRVLVEAEGHVGQSWKRFATALSNLFSFEKEVESARLGDKKISRDRMPYRKVRTSAVDECLRTFANHKVNRSVPSLRVLSTMLTAYVADLSAVEPSVDAYVNGLSQMAYLDEIMRKQQEQQQLEEDKSLHGSATSTSIQTTISQNSGVGRWRESLRALAANSKIANTIDNAIGTGGKVARKYVEDLRAGSLSSSHSDEDEGGAMVREKDLQRKRIVEDRVLANERLLTSSLTSLCKATTVRSARMAWIYFKTEARQCALGQSAAVCLREKIALSDKASIAKLSVRHDVENKEDMMTELELVHRMVNLGSLNRYPMGRSPTNGGLHETIEVDSDDKGEENAKASQRDIASQIASQRVGRWNSKLAMAIMTAVGVDDPNVRVDQTTRELRLVRKYAIGLREVLNRCIEAVEVLRIALARGHLYDTRGDNTKDTGTHIRETREECMKELANLFSGKLLSYNENARTTTKLLAENGIVTNDPLGWSTALRESSTGPKEQCRLAAFAYTQNRDSQTEMLLSSLSELLNEYTKRVEIVESFVYMECVGVQLEKFFSQKRADALAAFEKKTDITTAINIATRKRLPGLIKELQDKLAKLGSDVTHTSVKESKEVHLESKNIKAALHDLALRRLLRARETSTERVINLLNILAKGEETLCSEELSAVGTTLETLESFVGREAMINAAF